MGQVLTKNEGFSDFCEGWVPFLLEIKQKAGCMVGRCAMMVPEVKVAVILPVGQTAPAWRLRWMERA